MKCVITVTVKDMEGEMKTINVEIERFGAQKPYLGGFRHKDSGMEFMNASCQTNTKLRPWDGETDTHLIFLYTKRVTPFIALKTT